MHKGVAVTGMGIVSAIGMSVEENFDALCNGNVGISKVDNIDTKLRDRILVGEIKYTNEELAQQLLLPEGHNITRTGMLGMLAARQAFESAGLTKDTTNDLRIGLISSTSVGGMDITEKYFYQYESDSSIQKFIASHDAGVSTQQIADYLGIEGLTTTISTACSSAANAIMLGARLIQAGRLDRVIVGGTDALSKFTINGFNTLMILSDTYCQPFDQNRKGLNLGEAAAYIVLESEALIKAENKKVFAYLAGYGNANDAYHQTASSENGEGAYLAMQKALSVAKITACEIDYVNVHGTATPNNDLSEGRAMIRVFDDKIPDFSSTKSFTGHTLAAAAAIEAVYSILALNHDIVFPNLNFETPMEEFQLIPQKTCVTKEIRYVLSNSFGFGGNCSTLIFAKP